MRKPVELATKRNNTVLYIAEVISAPQARNKSYKILDLKWHKTFPLGTKYSEIENYLIDELPAYFPKVFRIVVDATGVGEAIWENVHDAMVKKGDKALIVGALGYMISPLDAVPDAIPIVGLTDDLAVLVYVLKKVWVNVEPEIKDKARARLSKWFDEDEITEIDDLKF